MSYSQQSEASNSAPATQAEIYDTTRFGELYYGSRAPGLNDLGLAARFLIQVFEYYQIPFAFLGGWAMSMRGSPRQTQDVDIAVGTTMAYLRAVLLQLSRLSVPLNYGETSIQVFVHVGGEFDTGYRAYAVSTDIIINGYLSTPSDIPNGTELIIPSQHQTPLGSNPIRVINLFFQLKCKLHAFHTRQATTNQSGQGNDYQDLVWLLEHHGSEIYYFSHALSFTYRSEFFQRFAAGNPQENVDYARRVLGLDQPQPTG